MTVDERVIIMTKPKINWLGFESQLRVILRKCDGSPQGQAETLARVDSALAAWTGRGGALPYEVRACLGSARDAEIEANELDIVEGD
jgi:hypothetical protein